MLNPKQRIEEIDRQLEELPKGTLTYKTIKGRKQPYIQRTMDGKSVSYYVRLSEREQIMIELEERSQLQKEKKYLLEYHKSLKDILERNPYLDEPVGLGYHNFQDFVCKNRFYVDKTHFISEWIRDDSQVLLLTRPRRFGKSMLLSTVENFFDPRFADHPERFEKLKVWKEERARECFGRVPVISISFGGCKGSNYKQAVKGILINLHTLYFTHQYLLDSDKLSDEEKAGYKDFYMNLLEGSDAGEDILENSIPFMCNLMYKHYGVKPYILLDEYDTPLLEAYTGGYWDEMIETCRQLFHNIFKENEYYQRAIITGVTRISRNSLFSDLNNVKAATITSDSYGDCCGFTEQEVKDALKCQNIDEMAKVKALYDGFNFGKRKDIYNPWSICNYLTTRELCNYWVSTSSNKLIGEMIRRHPLQSKYEIEQLMQGEKLHKKMNECISFQYLDGDEESLWSLLLSVGYVKAENVVKDNEMIECDLSVTNEEVMGMYRTEIPGMFFNGRSSYEHFTYALLHHNVDMMTDIMLDLTYSSMSYFDVGKGPKERTPENFYHGFVLGLIVSLKMEYRIVSNRESGRGRYDIAMYPLKEGADAFIIEFKVFDAAREKDLEETAQRALEQIDSRGYEADLLASGIENERIYKLGFGFKEKDVVIRMEAEICRK